MSSSEDADPDSTGLLDRQQGIVETSSTLHTTPTHDSTGPTPASSPTYTSPTPTQTEQEPSPTNSPGSVYHTFTYLPTSDPLQLAQYTPSALGFTVYGVLSIPQ